VGRDLMPCVRQSTMQNGPKSTYVWIVCCTSEMYKYQALIEAVGRNADEWSGKFSAHSLSCDVRDRLLCPAVINRWITYQLGTSQDILKFQAPILIKWDSGWKLKHILFVVLGIVRLW